MRYLNINEVIDEIIALMKNNYGGYSYKDKDVLFQNAKDDMLETFSDIINQNKEEVFDELKREE